MPSTASPRPARLARAAWTLAWTAACTLLFAACGDAVTGTTRHSPGLAPIDGVSAAAGDASVSPSPTPVPTPDAGAAEAAPPGPTVCAGLSGTAGDSTLTLTSGAYARDSLLHVPASYDPTKGTMLVVNYHGFSSNAPEQVALTGMNATADAKNFIVAYPDGLGNGWASGDCCSELQPPNVDDVQFTRDLLALVASKYCIDPHRIYATGFSNGGFMSHLLACKLSTVFAAVAPVSGVLGIDPKTCLPERPIPVLDIHGTADPVVPYDGGPALKLLPPIQFRSVDTTVNFWRSANSCLGAPTIDMAKGDAACVRWGDCQGGADVELCTLDGDGHQWPDSSLVVPGLGTTSTALPATEFIADWFIAHPGR